MVNPMVKLFFWDGLVIFSSVIQYTNKWLCERLVYDYSYMPLEFKISFMYGTILGVQSLSLSLFLKCYTFFILQI